MFAISSNAGPYWKLMCPKRTTIDDSTLGARLRQARLAAGLSLKAVESSSKGDLPAATVSFYERGERPVTAVRLYRLAEIYDIAIEDLIGSEQLRTAEPRSRAIGPPMRLDLVALEHSTARDARVLSGLVKDIQRRRASNSADTIALRQDDLVTAAATIGKSLESFVTSLRKAGLVRRPRGRPPKS